MVYINTVNMLEFLFSSFEDLTFYYGMFIFRRKELLSRKTKKERIIVYDGRSPQVLYFLIEMCFYCDCFSKQEQGCHGQGKISGK